MAPLDLEGDIGPGGGHPDANMGGLSVPVTPSGIVPPHPDRKTCTDCGSWYFNLPAHQEECPGPVFRCVGPEQQWIRDQFARDNDCA